MGTIIARKDKYGNPEMDVIPSKINNETFLQVLLNGGTAASFGCSDVSLSNKHEKCIFVSTANTTISHKDSFIGKIEVRLKRIQNSILDEKILLSKEDKEFIGKSRLPLHRIINSLTADKKGYSPVDLCKLADTIAMDVLIKYLREIIEIVQTGCEQLKSREAYSTKIDEYLKSLSHIEKTLTNHEMQNRDTLLQEKHLMDLVEKIQQKLLTEIKIN